MGLNRFSSLQITDMLLLNCKIHPPPPPPKKKVISRTSRIPVHAVSG